MSKALGADEFALAFARHGRTLWVLAAAWVGRSEASDLVQEVARIGWQRREQFVAGSDLRAWLSQIARHVGANWRRRLRPEPRAPDDLPDPVAPSPTVEPWPFDADRHCLSDELARALAELPEPARASLLLHVVAGHSFAEIGTMLELPENTACSHARRARLALRSALAATAPHRAPQPESP
ncbi:MAG TPA: RNA polymerase sigma factor [Planctomycetota bacterium]|nr:RNA polymerase sigma factor [Planctomycetota bacterium]